MAKPKNAVLLVRCPEGWLPTRVHSLPPAIVSASYLVRGVKLKHAMIAAHGYNRAHLQKDAFEGLWALCVRELTGWKAEGCRHPHGAPVVEGGAA